MSQDPRSTFTKINDDLSLADSCAQCIHDARMFPLFGLIVWGLLRLVCLWEEMNTAYTPCTPSLQVQYAHCVHPMYMYIGLHTYMYAYEEFKLQAYVSLPAWPT